MFLQNITEQQIQQFRQAFALFDKDGDGCINNKELKTVLRSLGHNPTKQELQIFTSIVDEDRSGTIDFREFLILISQRLNNKTLFDQIIESFKVMDRDNDGCLTRIQIKMILIEQNQQEGRIFSPGKLGFSNEQTEDQIQDKLQEIFQELDQQGEGKIDIVDFVTYIIRNQLKLSS